MRSSASSGITAARLVIGLVQGLVLFVLYQSWTAGSWPAQSPMVFRPLLMMALFVPPVIITGLAHITLRKLALWTALLIALTALIGLYDAWRSDLGTLLDAEALSAWRDQQKTHLSPSALALLLVAAGLFIGQAMVLAANADGRVIARYQSYFALAWKLALQIALALLFNLMLWLVLSTGAALFNLVKLGFLQQLLGKPWFNIPVFALAFASALHLTDVRPAIIAGVRKLLLTVLSWLLPLCTVIVVGFLGSLAVTGLEPLWQTRHASAVLLGTCAMLVVLINVLYQDGLAPESRRLVNALLRLACLLPLPLAALGIYALWLRVAQYGWTVDRITAALSMLVAALYAIGYAMAAVRRHQPMTLLAQTNVFASLAILAIFVAVLSPLADPARIAVADQLPRLLAGKTASGDFDARFWRFDSERYGVQALRTLEQSPGEQGQWLRQAAQQALRRTHKWESDTVAVAAADLKGNLRAQPSGSVLPPGFAATDWKKRQPAGFYELPACLRQRGVMCDLYTVHLPEQAHPYVLLFDERGAPSLFFSDQDGWRMVGHFDVAPSCRQLIRQAAAKGMLMWQRPPPHDLLVGGVQVPLVQPRHQAVECPSPTP
ncbi:DUF4153 domain-containing protein [Herbaspirillum seropedicae]|nr:DUF4153 domain-containing protein [Herbaspirillum sp. alder98]